jgi:molybdopterin-binding protein
MKISARNQIPGKVVEVTKGATRTSESTLAAA